jgi:putative peptidoglycan lipid II flippase
MSSPKSELVAKAGAIAMASIFLSRVIGLVRDAIITRQFGVNAFTDAFNASFRIPDLIFFLLAGGALSSAFIPVFSEYLAKDQEDDAWKVFSGVGTIMFVAVASFVVLAMVFAPQIAGILLSQNNPQTFQMMVDMGRIVLPAQVFFFLGGLMFAVFYCRGNYTIPGLGPNLYNIGIILGAAAISHLVSPGIYGASIGALLGAFAGNILVPLVFLRGSGVKYRWSLDASHPGVKKVFALMLPVILGLSLPSVFLIILTPFASQYATGTIAVFEYANKIQMVPLGIFGMSLALAVFPTLSEYWSLNNLTAFREQFLSTITTTIYLAVPVSVLFVACPDAVVRILYEGGKFSPEATVRTAEVLQVFGIGVLAWCMHPVLMRGFFATQDTKTPVAIGTLATGVFFALCWITVSLKAGQLFLAAAASLSAFLMVALLIFALSRRVQGLDVGRIVSAFGRCVLSSLVLAGVVRAGLWGWNALGSPGGWTGHTVAFALLFLVGAWGYYGVTRALGMKEAGTVERAMERFNKPKAAKVDPPSP